jgi:hypothetical protein
MVAKLTFHPFNLRVTRKIAIDACEIFRSLDTAAEKLAGSRRTVVRLARPGDGDHKQDTYSNRCNLMFLIKDLILNQGKRPRARASELYLLPLSPSSLPRK